MNTDRPPLPTDREPLVLGRAPLVTDRAPLVLEPVPPTAWPAPSAPSTPPEESAPARFLEKMFGLPAPWLEPPGEARARRDLE